ncbi:uncharacterized protein BO80DRAFT_416097 [Aspergillus ibericus CBS 121593]|uniref:Uncharacterized protein n=1 Tax=Aspergillus ibericus CBS 121593 TaxID=1448316 RepID=A0A395GPC5_9EURO|nr:hypothetical protein BO80DRAFT_416097 [Aspergillus ibericus CBS 121593]RAK96808.1 hypothetical protein BO80DRAFT_416097 [Aspergillus ibericus CBS 121593]
MPSNVYCPFCGVILLPDPYGDDPASPQTRVRPWYAEVRGVYATNLPGGQITITGLGIVRGRNNLHAPLDNDVSYVDVGLGALEEWRLCEPSEGRWCFGFHNSCWRLLLLRLGPGQGDHPSPNRTAIAEAVFYQLYCTPCLNASSFQLGHDYGGAAQTHKLLGRPRPADLSSHFYADPYAIPSMDDLEKSASDLREAHGGPHRPLSPNDSRGEKCDMLRRPNRNIFDRLSPELKLETFSYLSFDEILTMRLVCRGLARLLRLELLPQSYWRSRFLLGQEADFLFPKLTEAHDWSRLFLGTRASLKAGLQPLTNRKRIRQLLEPIAALVDLDAVLRRSPYGSACQPANREGSCFQLTDEEGAESPPQVLEMTGSFSGQLATISADRPLNEGCRVLYRRTQSLMSPPRQNRRRIGISTVQIGARSFISGVHLFPSGESNAIHRSVGYHNPYSQKWIDVPSTSHLEALSVAFCSEGLTGVKFTFTPSDSSYWVGESNGPGIAQGTLIVPERSNRNYLLAGLDHFKIVWLGLGELIEHPRASLKPHSQGVLNSSSVQSHLWTPEPPMHDGLMLSPMLPSLPSRAFEPLANIDFGGQRGLRLGSLTCLTFHMASRPHPLIGIEVSSSDGKSVLFGSNRGCGISFPVAGSKGERVNGVSILKDNREYYPTPGLGGLQISTNYGRTATFAPLHYQLDAVVEPIPISPLSNIITGLVSHDLAHQNGFVQLGVQSQQCDEEVTLPDILDRGCHEIPDDQVRYDQKFSHFINSTNPGNYQTYASLKNVRRIRASMGIHGRSRSPSRISGLKLEYYSHPSPSVVGQWMNELGNGFEISPDEEIQSFTIWLTPMGYSTECPGLEVGQVAAIRFETTQSRCVTFRSPDFQSLPPRKLQTQYKGDSDEKLTAMSWILNLCSDRVRALVSASGSRRPPIMVPEQPPPFDQVRKLYFERRNGGGSRESVLRADAYFEGQAIIGLAFIYKSGARASIGDVDTDTSRTVHFAQDAKIVGLSAAARGRELVEMEFEVEQGEGSRSHKLSISRSSREGPANTGNYDWRDVWCKDRASADSHQRLVSHDTVFPAPSGSRFVGIYVGCQEFSTVGALYEADVSPKI